MTAVTSPSPFPTTGALLLDRYELRSELGRGGYSVVYDAYDRRLDSDIAIKLLVPPPATAHIARERMRREARAIRELSHPNIVALYDFLEDGPFSFIAMERINGSDLATILRREGPLSTDRVIVPR